MANVRFIKTTKKKYLNRDTYDSTALYFCEDTGEIFKGQILFTDGIRIVQTKADLPECPCAADGVVYYVADTKSGYMMSPDRTEWLQTIYAPVDDVTTIPESEIYNTVTTVGAVRDIENAIYTYIDQEIANVNSGIGDLKPIDGTLIIKDTENGAKAIGVSISAHKDNALVAVDGGLFVPNVSVEPNSANGLVAVDGTISLNLATRKSAGAMSAQDKLIIDSIPHVYEARKYDISNVPTGTLVDYRDHEIRIMCPTDAEFTKQTVGDTGNPNMYYMTFRAYAPEGAVSFKEGDRGVIIDEMFYFNGPASGIDEFGRKYSVCWLALATYSSSSDTWTYFGKNSTEAKYVGWDYVVEWYNSDGQKIGFDSVRINLSNESCHYVLKPYYMNEVITATEAEEIKMTVAAIEESYSWGEM